MRTRESPASSSISSSASSVRRHRSRAASRPTVSTATGYGAAVPRKAKPPFRPLAPSATRRASWTRTRRPARASASAHERPVTPAPTIATCGAPSSVRLGISGAGSSSQKGTSMTRSLGTTSCVELRDRRQRSPRRARRARALRAPPRHPRARSPAGARARRRLPACRGVARARLAARSLTTGAATRRAGAIP